MRSKYLRSTYILTIGSPTTRDSAIGSPTTRDLATELFETWRLRQKLLRPEAENRKFRQDWLGGTRGVVTIKYVGNKFSFPGNKNMG